MNSDYEKLNDYQELQPTDGTDPQDATISNMNTQKDEIILPSEIEDISIYKIRTKLQRNLILAAVSIVSFLLPFSDTIYFPAITEIEYSLNTTAILVSLSVSIYLFMSGLFSLLWGSVSDRFGRKRTIIGALVIYLAASLVCIFAGSITIFIVFRALEGCAISATLVIGQGIVADIYPEDQRGSASGVFFLPFNIGPVMGPLVGGPLSAAFTWRSTFTLLSIYAVVAIVIIFVFVPETQQYLAKEHFQKANPTKRIIDAVPNERPPFGKPWKALTHLFDFTILPYITAAAITSATIITGYTLFSIYLSAAPYNYTATTIGLLYIPGGVSMFIGSLFGGWFSDKVTKYFKQENAREGRLVPAVIISFLVPIGFIIYGWVFNDQLSVIGAIIGQVLFSFGQAVVEASVSAYLTIKKQDQAAAVSAANTFLNFCGASVLVTFAIPMIDAMGTGFYFTFLAAINMISIAWFGAVVYSNLRRTSYISM